ncbi:MAG: 6-phosphogluconolactonase [Candidatus Obscuribacterales bacterium]|nr:6-phosphogluconolactonase [Candidatus Obscuribacterales bacterium]
MSEIRNYDNPEQVAIAAAENAVEILQLAIERNGSASWVLAGGTSPMLAYKKIIDSYSDALDWKLVTVLIGDERLVPLNHKDSNWGTIIELFESNELTAGVQKIVPDTSLPVGDAARAYDDVIKQAGIERFDLLWIGVGEDGHTLSLFPGNSAFTDETESWVIPVLDSPKLPSERISLSLKALEHVHELVIFAVGAGKKEALQQARLKGVLPVAVVADTVENYGGEVRWLYDDAAWGEK